MFRKLRCNEVKLLKVLPFKVCSTLSHLIYKIALTTTESFQYLHSRTELDSLLNTYDNHLDDSIIYSVHLLFWLNTFEKIWSTSPSSTHWNCENCAVLCLCPSTYKPYVQALNTILRLITWGKYLSRRKIINKRIFLKIKYFECWSKHKQSLELDDIKIFERNTEKTFDFGLFLWVWWKGGRKKELKYMRMKSRK